MRFVARSLIAVGAIAIATGIASANPIRAILCSNHAQQSGPVISFGAAPVHNFGTVHTFGAAPVANFGSIQSFGAVPFATGHRLSFGSSPMVQFGSSGSNNDEFGVGPLAVLGTQAVVEIIRQILGNQPTSGGGSGLHLTQRAVVGANTSAATTPSTTSADINAINAKLDAILVGQALITSEITKQNIATNKKLDDVIAELVKIKAKTDTIKP